MHVCVTRIRNIAPFKKNVPFLNEKAWGACSGLGRLQVSGPGLGAGSGLGTWTCTEETVVWRLCGCGYVPMQGRFHAKAFQCWACVGCGEEIWLLLETLLRASADKEPSQVEAGCAEDAQPAAAAYSLVREGAESIWLL